MYKVRKKRLSFRTAKRPAYIEIRIANIKKYLCYYDKNLLIFNFASEKRQSIIPLLLFYEIDMSDSPSGCYFIAIETDNNKIVKRIIIK